MTAARVDPALVSLARDVDIDHGYLRHVVHRLTSIGSSPLGFRNTGTEEDAAVARFVAEEMTAMGLAAVAVEDVDVDAWRFRSAKLVAGRVGPGDEAAMTLDACSFGGVPGTPPGGISGRLVDVRDARRRRLDAVDLTGAIALVDWRSSGVAPAAIVIELAARGVVGMVLNCPADGPWYQSAGALGAFDGHWPASAPPMIFIRKEDASSVRALLATGSNAVTMTLDAQLTTNAAGHNVVGYWVGQQSGPIVVGAHHDAWFRGAFDNTSGVAAMLAVAKALIGSGYRPRHTICFSSRTAEEYGISDSSFDWCIGAWRQVQDSHPDWPTAAPFHLCLEASGHRELRTVVEAPVELAAWARRVCRIAEREGWTPTGWRVAAPVAGTEQWPFLVSGIPGVAAYAWEKSFGKSDYHTQFDTADLLDFSYLALQARLYSLLLLEADRDPDSIIDHGARARELTGIAAVTGHAGLAAAAERRAGAKGRYQFTSVGRGLFALDAHSRVGYPHDQARSDIAAIDTALAALDSSDHRAALRHLRRVGSHVLFPYLSEETFRKHNQRSHPNQVARSWASASHLTQSPHLWRELASLSGEKGARAHGPWLRTSLLRARNKADHQLTNRLAAMARAAEPTPVRKGQGTP